MKGIKQEQKIIVGFKVVNNSFLEQLKEKLKVGEDPIKILRTIVGDYSNILELYSKLFLIEKGNNLYFKNFPKGTKIHYEFVRKFLNISIRKPARTPFVDFKALKNFDLKKFVDWFKENKGWANKLKNSLEEYKKQKTFNLKPTALIIKKINSARGINFIEKLTSQDGIDFVSKEMEKFLLAKQEINKKAKQIKDNLLKIENVFLTKTDTGLNIFNGSLNYFSVNKKLDDYQDRKKKLNQCLNEAIGDRYNSIFKNFGSDFNLFNVFSDYFEKYGYTELKQASLKDFRQILKDIKGKEKAKFLENVCDLEFEDFKKEYPLFVFSGDNKKTGEEYFQEFKNYSELLKDGKGGKDVAKKRGGFIDYQSGFCKAKNYANLNKLYEQVAKDYGQINAKLKAIENAIDNIRKLRYWLIFVQVNKAIKLVAIPKDKDLESLKKAFSFLTKNSNNKNSGIKVLILDSFTLKALDKLLFREDSSFRQGLGQEIKNDYLEKMKTKYLKARNNQAELNDEELVSFYQQVLRTQYAQNNLKFDFNKIKDILTKNYESVESFRIDLEKRLYEFKKIYLSVDEHNRFLKQYQAIEFNIVPVNTKKNPKNRWHKNLWPYFWTSQNQQNNFSVRINPEVKFFYKERDNGGVEWLISKYGRERVFDSNFKHRFLEDRIIAKINFETNIPAARIQFSFKEKFDVEREIEKFNQKFNQQNKDYQNAYYFGIDRGTDEFVSLGIYKINNKNYQPQREIVYKIKDEFLGKINIAQQKWFNDFNKYFEGIKFDYLDLTIAKLVQDKIIINSDWKTLLELTKLHYKNKIFSLVDELAVDDVFIGNKGQFFLKTTRKHNNGVVPIGYYRDNFSKFENGKAEEIVTELKNYIKEIKKYKNSPKFEIQFDKVVNYKKALAANVVGILEFLRKNYNNVYFVLENLDLGKIQKQSQRQAQAIHRQLEWILLNKLRKKGLVPSDISKQIIFREKEGDKQFGAVLFLEESSTSKLCPNCEAENMGGYNIKEWRKVKFQQRQIKCKKCGNSFHPDEIACINLAEKGYSFLSNRLSK